MTNPLDSLYTELVIEHDKRPQNAGLREPFGAESHHVNTSCGDEITLRLHLDRDDRAGGSLRIRDISYEAMGCSISMASTSILAEEVTGEVIHDAMEVHAAMRHMLTSRGQDAGDEEVIGDGVALAGVAKYPARVKCALLGWMALTDALAQAGVDLAASEGEQK